MRRARAAALARRDPAAIRSRTQKRPRVHQLTEKGLPCRSTSEQSCSAMASIPILHFLNRFWIGGSERQFVERLRAHPKGFEPVVACLERAGPLLQQIRDLGLEPIEFPLGGSMMRANTAAQVARIASLVRDRGIPIIHATDFNTNLLGVAAARL